MKEAHPVVCQKREAPGQKRLTRVFVHEVYTLNPTIRKPLPYW